MRINKQNDFEQFLKLKFLKKPKYLMTSRKTKIFKKLTSTIGYNSSNWSKNLK